MSPVFSVTNLANITAQSSRFHLRSLKSQTFQFNYFYSNESSFTSPTMRRKLRVNIIKMSILLRNMEILYHPSSSLSRNVSGRQREYLIVKPLVVSLSIEERWFIITFVTGMSSFHYLFPCFGNPRRDFHMLWAHVSHSVIPPPPPSGNH